MQPSGQTAHDGHKIDARMTTRYPKFVIEKTKKPKVKAAKSRNTEVCNCISSKR